MAVYTNYFPHCCCRQITCLVSMVRRSVLKPAKCISNVCVNKSVISEPTDPLDNFTNKLVQEKRTKWNKTIELGKELKVPETEDQEEKNLLKSPDFDNVAVSELLRRAIDLKQYGTLISLLSVCKANNFIPSPDILLQTASAFSRCGNKLGVEAVKSLCKIHNMDEYHTQAEFKHYIAEASWISGNVGEALKIFEDVYDRYPSLRRKIRSMTKYLIAECVSKRSEASVILVMNSARKYATEFKDFYFLSCLWQYLFLSEWFDDQKKADGLLEEFKELRKIVADKLVFVFSRALRQEETDAAQRAIEIALRYEMRRQYVFILRSFFDYKCSKGDLKGCTEILACAKEMNVALTEQQTDRFVALVVDHHDRHSWLSRKSNVECLRKKPKVPPFRLKF